MGPGCEGFRRPRTVAGMTTYRAISLLHTVLVACRRDGRNAGAGLETAAERSTRVSDQQMPDGSVGLGGTLGLVPGQVARLTFMPHGDGPGDFTPCILIARIRGLDGSVLAERRFERPPPNQRAFIEFAYPPTGHGRLQLYGELEHTPGHRIGAIYKTYDAHSGATIAAILPRIVLSRLRHEPGRDGRVDSFTTMRSPAAAAGARLARAAQTRLDVS